MEEIWKVIEDFPSYEVSNMGFVRILGGHRRLSPKKAKGDAWFVKLTKEGVRYSKTLKWLVAETFVPKPEGYDPELFDTPIQCVLNTDDVRAEKIMWRPRWFAIKYRRQLNDQPLYWDTPVMNLSTGTQHASILTASLADGTLMSDIYKSAGEGVMVFPTKHRYEFIWRIQKGFPSVHWDRV